MKHDGKEGKKETERVTGIEREREGGVEGEKGETQVRKEDA